MSSQQSNPKTSLNKPADGALPEAHLPALKRLVMGLEPACAANLPGDFKGHASTRLLALLNLAARGLAPTSLGGGAALLLKLLHTRFYGNFIAEGKTSQGQRQRFGLPPRSALRADTTALAAHCCAFLSPLENISSDQCRLLLQTLELHLDRSSNAKAKTISSTSSGLPLLSNLAFDCLTPGWAHEYLTEKQTDRLLSRTQFFTPSWIAAYLCAQAIGDASSFTLLDPACGAGHLLVQAVHASTQDHRSDHIKDGLAQRLHLLFGQSLYGLDLDADLIDLARFALYLTARDRLGESYKEESYSEESTTEETNGQAASFTDLPAPNLFCLQSPLGSLALAEDKPLFDVQGAPLPLPKKFNAVVMNPPYLSTRTMDDTTASFLKRNFPDACGDLYTAFIQLALGLLAPHGRLSTIVQQSFLSVSRYRSLRLDLLSKSRIVSCVQLGTGAFPSRPGEKVNNAIITLQKPRAARETRSAGQLEQPEDEDQAPIKFLRLHGKDDHEQVKAEGLINFPHASISRSDAFALINSLAGQPFAFHCPGELAGFFKSEPSLAQLESDFVLTNGLFTCDNNRFVKLTRNIKPHEQDDYVPYDKGGGIKWYHRTPYSLRWGKDGQEVRDFRVERGQSRSLPGESYYFQPGVTYSYIGTKGFCARLLSEGAVFDIASSAIFSRSHDLYYVLGFFNSALVAYLLSILNPTVNFQIGDLRRLPFKAPQPELESTVAKLSAEAVAIVASMHRADGQTAKKCAPARAEVAASKLTAAELARVEVAPAEAAALIKREREIQTLINSLIFDHYAVSKRARMAVLDEPWVKRSQRPIA